MASFKNVTGGRCFAPDENGYPVEFATGETRTGLSNYFYRYTSAGNANLTSPVLELVGSLDGDGTIPAAMVPQESAVFLPGATSTYPKNASDATAADLANTNAPRRWNITFDEKGDTQLRQVRTVFLGLKAVPDGTDPANIAAFAAANPDSEEGIFLTAAGRLFIQSGTAVRRYDADEAS